MQTNIPRGLNTVLPYSLGELTGVSVGYLALVCCDKHWQNDSFFRIFYTFYLGRGKEHYDAAIDHHKVHMYSIGVSPSEKNDVTAC